MRACHFSSRKAGYEPYGRVVRRTVAGGINVALGRVFGPERAMQPTLPRKSLSIRCTGYADLVSLSSNKAMAGFFLISRYR